jgi:hypothetical protein
MQRYGKEKDELLFFRRVTFLLHYGNRIAGVKKSPALGGCEAGKHDLSHQ